MINRIQTLLSMTLYAVLVPAAGASTTWYVDGVNGNDANHCQATQAACKTIGHAISLASSGDSIMVAAATYSENLTIGTSLTLVGSSAATTIIDGGGRGTVVKVSSATAYVTLSQFTIQNGHARDGGGIYNAGTLRIIYSTVSNNKASPSICIFVGCGASGGGIFNVGTLTINNTTVSGNTAYTSYGRGAVAGGGISNGGTLTVSNSTISGNSFTGTSLYSSAVGGGIANSGTAFVNNSTITGNSGPGGIWNQGSITMSSVTVSGNGGGVKTQSGQSAVIQNSILVDNGGSDCTGSMTSKGYNLGSDATCNFSGTGDRNNTDPLLGPLQNNGGPTATMALLPGSPAIDGGNPSGCTDGQGSLLKTDQRGMPRPDPEDKGGCDMGAYESQSDQP